MPILSIILFSKVSENNGQFLMISEAKLRHLHVSFLDIQGKRKCGTRKDDEK